MKIRLEMDDALVEDEVVIRCSALTEDVLSIQRKLMDYIQSPLQYHVTKGDADYYLEMKDILFFESSVGTVMVHTKDSIYETVHRLYELEEMLPGYFMRISKSTIVNLNQIYGIHKNITGASEIELQKSNKKVFVSRNYYKNLIQRLEEKRVRR